MELDGFIRDYQEYYSEYAIKKVEETETATGKLAVILNEAKSKRYPLYLIIDEYDNFTNTVLNEQGERMCIGQSPMPKVSIVTSSRSSRVISTGFSSRELVL